jgi:hypothetical protein
VNPDDRAADMPGFRVPPHSIADLESFSHPQPPCPDDGSATT